MSEHPFMPMYWGDFLADTMHLDRATAFSYMLLIAHYWRHGGLPDDPKQLAQIARLSPKRWPKTADTLSTFFHDGWRHKRIDKELAKAREISEKRREAVGKRDDRTSTIVDTRARATSPSPSPSLSNTSTESVVPSCGRAATRTAADDDFETFWKAYPKRGTAANPKKPAADKFKRAVKAGTDPQTIIAAAKRYAQLETAAGRAGTEKIAQAITWLNQQRWNDYPPVAGNGTGPPQPPDPSMPSDAELRARYGNPRLQ